MGTAGASYKSPVVRLREASALLPERRATLDPRRPRAFCRQRTRTIRDRVRCGCNLPMTWLSISLVGRKPGPFVDNRWLPSRAENCRTCGGRRQIFAPRKKRFFFSENSAPHAVHFAGRSGSPAHALIRPSTSRTTSRASLVVRHQCRGSKGSSDAAARSRSHARAEPLPQQPHAPRMRFGRHKELPCGPFLLQAPRQSR